MTLLHSKCDYGANEKKPIRPMLLHNDGGSVKNKKRYYKCCDGIMEEKIAPPSNGSRCFCCKHNGNVVMHNNALPLFLLL